MIEIKINTEQDEKRLKVLKEASIKINEYVDWLLEPQVIDGEEISLLGYYMLSKIDESVKKDYLLNDKLKEKLGFY